MPLSVLPNIPGFLEAFFMHYILMVTPDPNKIAIQHGPYLIIAPALWDQMTFYYPIVSVGFFAF
jgi:hypothetical protein